LLVADGPSSRIDVETCAIRVKQSAKDRQVESARSQLIARHSTLKLSNALKSLFCCDQISFSNPLLQHGMKRRMSTGSIISVCDVSEDCSQFFDSFSRNFPHLPEPAATAAEIEKEIDNSLFTVSN
jgi:hypothetical protein